MQYPFLHHILYNLILLGPTKRKEHGCLLNSPSARDEEGGLPSLARGKAKAFAFDRTSAMANKKKKTAHKRIYLKPRKTLKISPAIVEDAANVHSKGIRQIPF